MIKQIIYDSEDQIFYILANMYQGRLGFFMICFHELDDIDAPDFKPYFLIKLKNKLDIADANIHVLRNKEERYKELLVSYKTIFVNTYNLTVIDISDVQEDTDIQKITFRFECFQLWESKIRSFFMESNQDFVAISADGIDVLDLSPMQCRKLKSNLGEDLVLHSLEAFNYLCIDPNNVILFDLTNDHSQITVQH